MLKVWSVSINKEGGARLVWEQQTLRPKKESLVFPISCIWDSSFLFVSEMLVCQDGRSDGGQRRVKGLETRTGSAEGERL